MNIDLLKTRENSRRNYKFQNQTFVLVSLIHAFHNPVFGKFGAFPSII